MSDIGRGPNGCGTLSAGRPEAEADRDLLERLRDRDESALETLYDRYAGLIYSLAVRIVGDPELAQEVLQDTFVRCWQGATQYDGSRGSVAGWLLGIARNRAIDVLRGRQHQARLRERSMLEENRSAAAEPDLVQAVVLRQVVGAALNELPARQRAAIELAYYGGLTQTEIAARLGEPLGTVKSHLRSGLMRLRGLLGPAAEGVGEEPVRRV